MKYIIWALIYLILIVGCNTVSNSEPKKELVDMNCAELKEKVSTKPYIMVTDNELYKANVLSIMKLKECKI